MSFRVTPHRQFELGQFRSQKHYSQGARIQEQVSSGYRINRPSDNPVGQKVVLNQSSLIQRYTTQISSLNTTRTILSDAQVQVLDAQQLLVKAKQIALQARQATEPNEQHVAVQQLNSILGQLDAIANAQSDGHYLFAGTQSGAPPFAGIVDGPASYQGASEAARVQINEHTSIKSYYTGTEVFTPQSSGTIVVSGKTGLQPGTGTSSGSVHSTVILRHTATTYSGTSGIQAGTSSAGGDTVLGSAGNHQLTITDSSNDGSFGTISLNGGPPVTYSNADTDLLVTGPDGEKVFVNTQSITAGFDGTVSLTATGTLSVDGWGTETPILFADNQVLTDAASGVTLFVDTSNVKATGVVTVAPASTADVFESVRQLRDTILNADGLTSTEVDRAFERSLSNLDAASDHLLKIVGEQSVDLEHLNVMETRIEVLQLNATTLLDNVQGTDYALAITQLQEQQNLLQFTLQTLMVANRTTILDFL